MKRTTFFTGILIIFFPFASLSAATTLQGLHLSNQVVHERVPDGPIPRILEGNITLEKRVDPSLVKVGDMAIYTITIDKKHPNPLVGNSVQATLTDKVPAVFKIIDVEGENCDVDGNIVKCSGYFPNGVTTVKITVEAKVDTSGELILNEAILKLHRTGREIISKIPVGIWPAMCGDGVVNGREECDNSAPNQPEYCRENCTLPVCGDGIVDKKNGEECDEGRMYNGTGANHCSSTCNVIALKDERCYSSNVYAGKLDYVPCIKGTVCGQTKLIITDSSNDCFWIFCFGDDDETLSSTEWYCYDPNNLPSREKLIKTREGNKITHLY